MQLGVIGLGTMGANLARNAARNGATVAVFNRTTDKTDAFMKAYGSEGNFVACHTLADLAMALTPPRPVLLLVKAGDPVDEVIAELESVLEKGDIIIDAGNSHDSDTERRSKALHDKGFAFVGMGVSGGEEGALRGPSMMPGGDRTAYDRLAPLLQKMAADDGDGGKCVSYIGPGGAGHFVKMVHNGIEYGIMQLIAEAYHLLKSEGGLSNTELAKTFGTWSKNGYLASFLMEITADVFRKKDDLSGADLIDVILDKAGQKGTGKWTTASAMDLGVAVPTITAAVDARIVSSAKDFRVQRSKVVPVALVESKGGSLIDDVRAALDLSIITAYAQGFQMLSVKSAQYESPLNITDVARIWRGGCIIRSALLPESQKMFAGDEKAALRVREHCGGENQKAWRRVVSLGALRGIPLPAFSASLAYYDAYRTDRLPQNLIQAQRDYFGAHTYERVDKPGVFHTEWKS